MTEELYMKRCLELAALGAGAAAPNPMVGCVIVHDGRIIGEGWHRRCGEAHAEVNAVAIGCRRARCTSRWSLAVTGAGRRRAPN